MTCHCLDQQHGRNGIDNCSRPTLLCHLSTTTCTIDCETYLQLRHEERARDNHQPACSLIEHELVHRRRQLLDLRAVAEVVRVADSPALRREEKRRRKRLPSQARVVLDGRGGGAHFHGCRVALTAWGPCLSYVCKQDTKSST